MGLPIFQNTLLNFSNSPTNPTTPRNGNELLNHDLSDAFLQKSPFAMGIVEVLEQDLLYQYMNPAAAHLHGHSSEKIIGCLASEVGVEAKIRTEWLAYCREVLLTKAPVDFQTTFKSEQQTYLLDVSLFQIGQSEKTGRPLLAFVIEDVDQANKNESTLTEILKKDNELQFQILANSMNQLAWMADAQGWVYWFNNRWYEFTGSTPQEMQGWGWGKTHHPDHLDRIVQIWRESLPKGQPIEVTFPLKGKDGEYRWFLTRVEAVRNASGEIVRWFGTSTDIHEQKQLEADLKKTEERLSMAIENAHVGFYDWEIPQNHMIFSERMMKDWGIASKESCSTLQAAFLLIHPEDRQRVDSRIQSAIKNKSQYEIEYRVVHPDGKVKWMDVHGSIRYDENGQPVRFFGTSVDITAKKETEEDLKKREKELRAIVEGMPQMAFMADPDGNITYYNSQHYLYFGVQSGETENWAWKNTKIHHEDDLERTVETWEEALRSGNLYEIEYRLRRHDGQYRWHLGRAYPIKDDSGAILRWVGTNTDIQEQRAQRFARPD